MPGVQFELPLQVGQQDAPVEQWSSGAVEQWSRGAVERRRRRGAGTAVYLYSVWFDG
jgi:hypothetical protein